MRAQQLRTIIISQASLVDVQAALDALRNGNGILAAVSGTVDYTDIRNVTLVGQPWVTWDGTKHNVFLFVTAS